MPNPAATAQLILGPDDPAPFVLLEPSGPAPALIVCDHASRAVPAAFDRLGLTELQGWQHIAWDLGAGEVARGLSHALGAPAVLAGYSRLVVDCNRDPGDPEAFREESDGCAIPGNRGLTAAARELRLATFFDPYHGTIAGLLDGFAARGVVPLLVAVHSFAPRLGSQDDVRPWHCGVLWGHDEPNARRLLAALRAEPGLVVGDNEPYSGRHPANYTILTHGAARALPHVCIEVRQDLVESPGGVERWVRRLSRIVARMLSDPEVRTRRRDDEPECRPTRPR